MSFINKLLFWRKPKKPVYKETWNGKGFTPFENVSDVLNSRKFKSNHELQYDFEQKYYKFKGWKPILWVAGTPIFTTYELGLYLSDKDKLIPNRNDYVEYHNSLYNKGKSKKDEIKVWME